MNIHAKMNEMAREDAGAAWTAFEKGAASDDIRRTFSELCNQGVIDPIGAYAAKLTKDLEWLSKASQKALTAEPMLLSEALAQAKTPQLFAAIERAALFSNN